MYLSDSDDTYLEWYTQSIVEKIGLEIVPLAYNSKKEEYKEEEFKGTSVLFIPIKGDTRITNTIFNPEMFDKLRNTVPGNHSSFKTYNRCKSCFVVVLSN